MVQRCTFFFPSFDEAYSMLVEHGFECDYDEKREYYPDFSVGSTLRGDWVVCTRKKVEVLDRWVPYARPRVQPFFQTPAGPSGLS